MAFNYENPHNDPNLGNYDAIYLEVKDFQKKLDDYQEEVNQKLSDQDAEIGSLRDTVNGQINELRTEVRDFERDIRAEVDDINQHTEQYVDNYLTENITQILETNPVVETKFEKIGYIDTNETCTLELEEDKLYEIMTIDYALNMHKALAVNNAFNITQTPAVTETVTGSVLVSEGTVPLEPPVTVVTSVTAAQTQVIGNSVSLITGSSSNNVLTITNTGTNRVRVYAKIIGEL